MSNIGERLLKERKRLGLNQDQMAASGGVAKRTYCNYEAGEREPMGGFFTAISAIGADVQYILTGMRSHQVAEESPGYAVLDKREAALIENYRHIADEEDKRCVERTALLAAKADKKEGTNG
jgi:transcriptional regulator with XRE-family HTH domain